MTTFYICRHGETENNKRQYLQGWVDTPLTESGLRNVVTTIGKLRDVRFDAIHSSDLGRAFTSAYLISRGINFTDEIQRHLGLREVNYGDFGNRSWKEVCADDPELLNRTDFVSPNGESLGQMQKRVLQCLTDVAQENPGKTILISTHDGPINAVYASFKNLDIGTVSRERVNPNDFVAKLTMDNGKVTSFQEV